MAAQRCCWVLQTICFRNLQAKGSHLCPLTPGQFYGVWWTCALFAAEWEEGRCHTEPPLPEWPRPKTHPGQCSAEARLWMSPSACTGNREEHKAKWHHYGLSQHCKCSQNHRPICKLRATGSVTVKWVISLYPTLYWAK